MHLLNSRLFDFSRHSADTALGANDRFAIFVASTGVVLMTGFTFGHILSGRMVLGLMSALPGMMLVLNIHAHLRARHWPAPPFTTR